MKIIEVFAEFSALEIGLALLICLALTVFILPKMIEQRRYSDSDISTKDISASIWSVMCSKTVIVIAIFTLIALFFIWV